MRDSHQILEGPRYNINNKEISLKVASFLLH